MSRDSAWNGVVRRAHSEPRPTPRSLQLWEAAPWGLRAFYIAETRVPVPPPPRRDQGWSERSWTGFCRCLSPFRFAHWAPWRRQRW